jgi:hypothetical protein
MERTKLLFTNGRPLQARELIEMQDILHLHVEEMSRSLYDVYYLAEVDIIWAPPNLTVRGGLIYIEEEGWYRINPAQLTITGNANVTLRIYRVDYEGRSVLFPEPVIGQDGYPFLQISGGQILVYDGKRFSRAPRSKVASLEEAIELVDKEVYGNYIQRGLEVLGLRFDNAVEIDLTRNQPIQRLAVQPGRAFIDGKIVNLYEPVYLPMVTSGEVVIDKRGEVRIGTGPLTLARIHNSELIASDNRWVEPGLLRDLQVKLNTLREEAIDIALERLNFYSGAPRILESGFVESFQNTLGTDITAPGFDCAMTGYMTLPTSYNTIRPDNLTISGSSNVTITESGGSLQTAYLRPAPGLIIDQRRATGSLRLAAQTRDVRMTLNPPVVAPDARRIEYQVGRLTIATEAVQVTITIEGLLSLESGIVLQIDGRTPQATITRGSIEDGRYRADASGILVANIAAPSSSAALPITAIGNGWTIGQCLEFGSTGAPAPAIVQVREGMAQLLTLSTANTITGIRVYPAGAISAWVSLVAAPNNIPEERELGRVRLQVTTGSPDTPVELTFDPPINLVAGNYCVVISATSPGSMHINTNARPAISRYQGGPTVPGYLLTRSGSSWQPQVNDDLTYQLIGGSLGSTGYIDFTYSPAPEADTQIDLTQLNSLWSYNLGQGGSFSTFYKEGQELVPLPERATELPDNLEMRLVLFTTGTTPIIYLNRSMLIIGRARSKATWISIDYPTRDYTNVKVIYRAFLPQGSRLVASASSNGGQTWTEMPTPTTTLVDGNIPLIENETTLSGLTPTVLVRQGDNDVPLARNRIRIRLQIIVSGTITRLPYVSSLQCLTY